MISTALLFIGVSTALASTKATIASNDTKAVVTLDNAEKADGDFLFDLLNIPTTTAKGFENKRIVSANNELSVDCKREVARPANTICNLTFQKQNKPFSGDVLISTKEQFVSVVFDDRAFPAMNEMIPENEFGYSISPDERFSIMKKMGQSEHELWINWIANPANESNRF